MFVELHILQNFAPSNLNRDDTGSPKDCEFGGYRRARISSQALKRAARWDSGFQQFMEKEEGGGVRTRRLVLEIAERISGKKPAPDSVTKVVSEVFKEGGLERQTTKGIEDDFTKVIVFMDKAALDEMANVFKERWTDLTKGSKETKDSCRAALGEILAKAVKSPDIALFGRMIAIEASKPFGKLNLKVNAASQVAHAISTNKVSMEFDFYTAVDDLLPKGETGAGMMGTQEFNSACFYRYANVDCQQLLDNLGGDTDLARKTVDAFLRAFVHAVPQGKIHGNAQQNPPSLIFAVVRDAGLWNLANAFLKPVYPTSQQDLMEASIARLDGYWGRMAKMYSEKGITLRCATTLAGPDTLSALKNDCVDSLEDLIQLTLAAVKLQPIA